MIRERIQDMNESEVGRYPTYGGYGSPAAGGSMSPFLVGAIAGAAVALLFAPQPGRDSRRWLADKARQIRHRGHEEGPGELEFGGSTYPEGRERDYGSGKSTPAGGSITGTGSIPKTTPNPNPIPGSPTSAARTT